jgi:hypothetical protein
MSIRPTRLRRRTAAGSALLALAGGTVLILGAAGAHGDINPEQLAVSGVPKHVGTRQAFPLNVSGIVPPALLRPGHPVSVAVSAVDTTHVPEGYCPTTRGEGQILVETVKTPAFSITKRVRINSDLDFHDKPSYPYRVCVQVFPNAAREGQPETEASYYRLRAATTRVQGRHADLPHRVTGRVSSPDGSGVGGIRVTAKGAGGASAITGPSGRYELYLGRGTATITPSGGGATFAPGDRRVKVPAARAQDFVATVPAG